MSENNIPAPALSVLLDEMSRQSYPAGTLYVVATPIGNVGDISVRALHLLSIVDVVACEDTRNTAQLLNRYGLSKKLIAAHQHNEHLAAAQIIEQLQAGKRIALVSDAGTPAISDPGARIVHAVKSAGLRVSPVPGPSAATAVLSASGLLGGQFYFAGFLPAHRTQRLQELKRLSELSSALVFYEAPHRIEATVADMRSLFDPASQLVIAREVTKLFEEIHCCPLAEATTWLNSAPNRMKGEFVLILDIPEKPDDFADTRRILTALLSELPLSQAVALAVKITGHKKNAIYQMALEIKDGA